MLIAGYSWVIRNERAQACDVLWLFSVCSLLTAPFGQSEKNQELGWNVYAGLTGGSNYLGFLLAISSAWLMWQVLLAHRKDYLKFWLFIGLFVLDAYFLYMSHSRASMLMLPIILFGVFWGMGKIKKLLTYFMVGFVLIFSGFNFYQPLNDALTKYAFKSDLEVLESVGSGFWYSREQVWQESYERAAKGGVFGAGIGVTMSEEFSGKIGATVSSGQYGREHGNAQLAILEQIGLIGFGFYFGLLVAIYSLIIRVMRGSIVNSDRIASGLLTGVVTSLLLQSTLEAWWVAPGSVESAVFWLLLGALIGTSKRAMQLSLLNKHAPATINKTLDESGTTKRGMNS